MNMQKLERQVDFKFQKTISNFGFFSYKTIPLTYIKKDDISPKQCQQLLFIIPTKKHFLKIGGPPARVCQFLRFLL